MKPLLQINNLGLCLKKQGQLKSLVSNINFEIHSKQTLALLGETGSGKSLTALSVLRLLPDNFFVRKESQVLFEGVDLLSLPESKMRKIRGGKIGIVFQDPMNALNPVMTIGEQIEENIRAHQSFSKKESRINILTLLEKLKLEDPERVYRSYAHQLSGGMKQRAIIAMAISVRPKLLIVDEPTTALDVITRTEILKLLKALQAQYQFGILLITHDLAVVSTMADQVLVMKEGCTVEQGSTNEVLLHTKNTYTQKLVFSPPTTKKPVVLENSETVLSLHELNVSFPIKKGILNRTVGHIAAIRDIDLSLQEGETLAIIGGSGSGKTTLARSIVSLVSPSSGEIVFLGDKFSTLSRRQLHEKRVDIQFVFQDPLSAMDPRFLVKDIIEEGMLAFKVGSCAGERMDRIDTLLRQVGLSPEYKNRYPHELSGGQRQRICIARALALGPRLLICDEPTSSLDACVQSQIIDLFIQLQAELEISYVFITHNIAAVCAMAHRIVVMEKGRIVEQGLVEAILEDPRHPYTRRLLEASKIS